MYRRRQDVCELLNKQKKIPQKLTIRCSLFHPKVVEHEASSNTIYLTVVVSF